MNLASDVPPDVDNSGVFPVWSSMIFDKFLVSFPGEVRKESPECSNLIE